LFASLLAKYPQFGKTEPYRCGLSGSEDWVLDAKTRLPGNEVEVGSDAVVWARLKKSLSSDDVKRLAAALGAIFYVLRITDSLDLSARFVKSGGDYLIAFYETKKPPR
jgi:hypothetical protein